MSTEKWKEIAGYEGLYQISSLGRVKSLPRMVKSSIQKCGWRTTGLKIVSGTPSPHYLQIYLCRERRRQMARPHRLVALAFIPNPEGKTNVNHKNGDKRDNRVENLEWVTPRENVHHAKGMGIMGGRDRKDGSTRTQVTEDDVLQIRTLKAFGARVADLASCFNVSEACIAHIFANLTWRHLPLCSVTLGSCGRHGRRL